MEFEDGDQTLFLERFTDLAQSGSSHIGRGDLHFFADDCKQGGSCGAHDDVPHFPYHIQFFGCEFRRSPYRLSRLRPRILSASANGP